MRLRPTSAQGADGKCQPEAAHVTIARNPQGPGVAPANFREPIRTNNQGALMECNRTSKPFDFHDRRRALSTMLIGAGVTLLLTACGGSTPTEPAQPITVTRTSIVTQTVSVPATTSAAAASAPASPSASAPSVAAEITVPNGVGLNYQQAQDLWRAAGLHVAPAHDATGANRLPVIDSNWVVLSQDLKPGTKVPAGSIITATVKKYTDQ